MTIEDYISSLPTTECSLSVNGTKLEEVVLGFRITGISGREAFEYNVSERENSARDGSEYMHKTLSSKDIEISYNITTDTRNQYNASLDLLKKKLIGENIEIKFDDFPNFYYIGNLSSLNADPAVNMVGSACYSGSGTITLRLSDSIRYSSYEKTFTATKNGSGILEASIQNEGTIETPISYVIEHNHDNGFIGIVTSSGTIQIGNKQEVDAENYKQNENLIEGLTEIKNAPDDHGTNYLFPERDTGGTLSYMDEEDAIVLGSMGEGTPGKWCGGLRTIEIPADSEGDVGAKNFWCYMNWYFQTGLMGQTGEQTIAFLTSDNKVICGYRLAKWDMSGNSAALDCWINGKLKETKYFYPTGSDRDNPFNGPRGNQDIAKEGDSIRFYWNGVHFSVSDPEIENMVCTKIQIGFTQFYGRNTHPWGQYVTRNYLRNLIFQKMYVDKWIDVPNKYSSGDIVEIDGDSRKIYKNGINVTGDEIIGSNYPAAPVGTSKVEFYFSDFSKPEPTITVKIKERFI